MTKSFSKQAAAKLAVPIYRVLIVVLPELVGVSNVLATVLSSYVVRSFKIRSQYVTTATNPAPTAFDLVDFVDYYSRLSDFMRRFMKLCQSYSRLLDFMLRFIKVMAISAPTS